MSDHPIRETPAYFGILPASVRYDKEVIPRAAILFTEFTALSNKYGYCNAKNSYFAELYGVSDQAVSKWVTNLRKQGHIETEYIYEGKEIKERRIYPIAHTRGVNERFRGGKRQVKGVSTTGLGGINERAKGNNTSINNTSINNNTHTKENFEKDILEVEKAFKDFTGNEDSTAAEKLPIEERQILTAIAKALTVFEKYPAMITKLPADAKITDPNFDLYRELEMWVRHNGTRITYLKDIDRKVSGDFGKWLFNYRPQKISNYGNAKTNSATKNKHLISKQTAEEVYRTLEANGL